MHFETIRLCRQRHEVVNEMNNIFYTLTIDSVFMLLTSTVLNVITNWHVHVEQRVPYCNRTVIDVIAAETEKYLKDGSFHINRLEYEALIKHRQHLMLYEKIMMFANYFHEKQCNKVWTLELPDDIKYLVLSYF